MITWFGNSPLDGTCSLYPTNITLNTLSGAPLSSCYKVQVGVDEKKNIVIRPLSKDQVERGDIPEETIFPYQVKRSYSRICSSKLMKSIAESLSLTLAKDPLKFKTCWNEEEGYLVVLTGKGA